MNRARRATAAATIALMMPFLIIVFKTLSFIDRAIQWWLESNSGAEGCN